VVERVVSIAIRESQMHNVGMVLKPQDIVVVLKLCGYGSKRPPFAQIAAALAMSSSEVHAAVKRAQAAHLLHGSEMNSRPNVSALEEFLIHGLKYAFPAEHGGPTRGIPTSYAAPPLNRLIAAGDEPIPVWPHAEGKRRGIALAPLYKTVPIAAMRDPSLCEKLALVDALRDGRTRERKLAEQELKKLLRKKAAG
jgi:DNA-binding Lrp family transcriptional regulator